MTFVARALVEEVGRFPSCASSSHGLECSEEQEQRRVLDNLAPNFMTVQGLVLELICCMIYGT